jgi:hypothetical protein
MSGALGYVVKMIVGILFLGGLVIFVLNDIANPFVWMVFVALLIAGRKLIFPAILGIFLIDIFS